MIIGLCGRMRSGKTELAKVCQEHGYKLLYFALPLKQLCADLLGTSLEELNVLKNNGTPINRPYSEENCKFLHDETAIPLEIIREACLGRGIENVRAMLQFIGTDLIRKHNKDWHVNKLREMIEPNNDYVFDDVRFPNEKQMIEELGGDCWFVVRPTLENISNHESETSLNWGTCYNKVIINDTPLQYLLFKWEMFLDNYSKSCKVRETEFNKILNNGYTFDNIASSSILDMLLLSKHLFDYIPREYDASKIAKVAQNSDSSVFIVYSDGSRELVDNPLSIEDLKMIL